MLAGHDGVAAEVLVGKPELVHVALKPQRVHLRGSVETVGLVPAHSGGHGPGRLTEAVPGALVEGTVDHDGVGRPRNDGSSGVLDGSRTPASTKRRTGSPTDLRDADGAYELQLVVGVLDKRDQAVDVGRLEAGVQDRRTDGLSGQLQFAAA